MHAKPSLFKSFFNSEKSGGFILILCTLLSILIANSTIGDAYAGFWNTEISGHTLTEWINDGLMTFFFLLIGLELEREIYAGELSSLKKASLPAFSALGGVIIPALIFFSLNMNSGFVRGVGIPMATDIAFAIGILSLLGDRVPFSLKIFLTALAVIDDLIAIFVIAIFYTSEIHFLYLLLALCCFLLLFILNRKKIEASVVYIIGGIMMWFFMFHSGIHPTISGVLLAFALPFGDGSKNNISFKWQEKLHHPIAFFVLPVFALANTCIYFENDWTGGMTSTLSLGVIAGLTIGKPIGILLFSFLSVWMGICKLPADINWKYILGAGMLGGIGFTMSIFITLLAFETTALIEISKIAILFGSMISAIVGLFFLKIVLPQKET
jgi:NhaA family Na+:H+ antiporter